MGAAPTLTEAVKLGGSGDATKLMLEVTAGENEFNVEAP